MAITHCWTLVPHALTVCALAASLAAQGVQGGDYVATDYGTNTVFRVPATGTPTVLHAGSPLTSASGLAVNEAQEVLVADYNSGKIFKIPKNGALTPFASGIGGPIRLAVDHDGTTLVTALGAKALQRVSATGVVTTIATSPSFVRPFGIAVDSDGSYVMTDDGNGTTGVGAVYRVTRQGVVTPLWQGLPLRLPQGVTLWHDGDYAIIDGLTDTVYRLPRAGGPPVAIVGTPVIDNPDAVCSDFEGRVVLAESSSRGSRLDLVDRFGTVTPLWVGSPFSNLEVVARVPRLSGPATGGPGLTSPFALECGGEGGKAYAMFATLTLFPGLALPNGDTRAIPGNPDVMFQLSAGANNAVFVGWGGVLSASGTAAPQLATPNIPLSPLTLWVQALTIDPAKVNYLGSFTNVHRIDL